MSAPIAPGDGGAARIGLALLVAVLHALQVANLLGPPPPDTRTLAVVALGVYLFPLWASWVDRHRRSGRIPS